MKNSLIVKTNSLIDGRYHLTVQGHRLVLKLASLIYEDDKDFKIYEISLAQLEKDFGVKFNMCEIKQNCKILISKVIEINDGDSWKLFSLLSSARGFVKNGKGYICLSFHPEMKSHYLGIGRKFTKYQFQYIQYFKKESSFRIYELCKQYDTHPSGNRSFLILDLMSHLGLTSKKSYQIYGNLKKHIILPAINEINKYSDIYLELHEKITKGKSRSVEKVIFYITKNTGQYKKVSPKKKDSIPNLETLISFPEEIIKKVGFELTDEELYRYGFFHKLRLQEQRDPKRKIRRSKEEQTSLFTNAVNKIGLVKIKELVSNVKFIDKSTVQIDYINVFFKGILPIVVKSKKQKVMNKSTIDDFDEYEGFVTPVTSSILDKIKEFEDISDI